MMEKKLKSPLEEFMTTYFPFNEFKRAGIFTKEMKGDYEAQANKICAFFGFNSIYEYRTEEIRCHLSFPRTYEVNSDGELVTEPFVTIIPPINFFHV